MKPHPNLSDEINATLDFFDGEGVNIKDLTVGDVLVVQTENSVYELEVVDPLKRLVRVTSDNPKCSNLGECVLQGSNFGGSMLKLGWVCGGTWMELIRGSLKNIGEYKGLRLSQTQTVRLVRKSGD